MEVAEIPYAFRLNYQMTTSEKEMRKTEQAYDGPVWVD